MKLLEFTCVLKALNLLPALETNTLHLSVISSIGLLPSNSDAYLINTALRIVFSGFSRDFTQKDSQ